MKFRTIRIQNLLVIRDATLVFDENGVFHIVGRNNVGKSAALNAINILLNNVNQLEIKEFLRDDTATFTIEAEMYDGSTVKLSRGATDYYAWNVLGNEGRLDKTKGKVPEVLQNYFKLYTDNERTKECLNIRLPRDILTFVDTTKTETYYLVQKALRTEEYLLASQKAEAKKREITTEQKQVRTYIERDQERITQAEAHLMTLKTLQQEMDQQMLTIEHEYELYMALEQVALTAQAIHQCDEQIRQVTNGIDIERGEQLKHEIEEYEMIEHALNMMIHAGDTKNRILALRAEVAQADMLQTAIAEYIEIQAMKDATAQYVQSTRAVTAKQAEVEQAQKAHMDFMVVNKFCPIVMNSLDQRCPFSVNVGG